ncbi:protein-glutamine gamma-glutamyltransferase 5-like [Spea bombifrons]|uniref:protein-glutamine gamma-glutamyltransferase 5-like n=1 Tax=Spea bombifrons TaxID=233779 RepID=UPI0023490500|nr:protein-glutamine gamma-glutamyltransferase 5-like [Spea bombifrons]
MNFPPELYRTDFNKSKNGEEHRTQVIRSKELIIRRGQPFTVTLLFRYRAREEKLENLKIIAETGPYPSPQAGTQTQFPVSEVRGNKWWSAEVDTSNDVGNGVSLSIRICSPAAACVGRYSLYLGGTYWGTQQSFFLGTIVLLFNPWCPDDDVFLDNETLRQEYVMNENGFLYQGSKDFIQNVPWNFGQFEDGVGDICLKILDMSPSFLKDPAKDCSKRGDPVYVSRIISAMINSNDDQGVIESSWDEYFRSGTNPSSWNGSVAILRLWLRSNCRPVRYGQCWVLAGVMCTVMRFLGIPTRVITNFESAHDTNYSLSVDEYYDETGKKLEATEGDSVWNFHVWNECWMARRDLRSGYDGWQVLDATPQEISGGTYCCGPAPVKAVKEGDVDVDYDVPFVFAEVNGDIIHWVVRENGLERGQTDTLSIGKHISTKSVGSNTREDITSQYKYAEGSQEERNVFEKALLKMKTTKPYKTSESVVALDFDVSLKLVESPLIGQTILLIYRIFNKTRESKEYSVSVSAQEMQYNGKPLEQFWKEKFDMDVNPNRAMEKSFQLHPVHYQRYVRSGNNIRVTALATDLKTKKIKLAVKNIIFEMPAIDVKVYGKPQLYQPLSIMLNFANPSNDILSNCVMTAEGAGLTPNGPIIVYMDQIFPRRSGYVKIFCVPVKSGKLQLEVNFSSDKIKFVKGSAAIEVPWL